MTKKMMYKMTKKMSKNKKSLKIKQLQPSSNQL